MILSKPWKNKPERVNHVGTLRLDLYRKLVSQVQGDARCEQMEEEGFFETSITTCYIDGVVYVLMNDLAMREIN